MATKPNQNIGNIRKPLMHSLHTDVYTQSSCSWRFYSHSESAWTWTRPPVFDVDSQIPMIPLFNNRPKSLEKQGKNYISCASNMWLCRARVCFYMENVASRWRGGKGRGGANSRPRPPFSHRTIVCRIDGLMDGWIHASMLITLFLWLCPPSDWLLVVQTVSNSIELQLRFHWIELDQI